MHFSPYPWSSTVVKVIIETQRHFPVGGLHAKALLCAAALMDSAFPQGSSDAIVSRATRMPIHV